MIRPCRECGASVQLKIQRDVVRKFYCSRECRSRYTGRLKDMQPLWAAANTPEANAKKGHQESSHHNWRPIGTRSLSAHGYVKLKTDVGWEYEHRLVARTPSGKDTHHIDSNKTNNDPGNLVALSKSEHSSLHRRMSVMPSKSKAQHKLMNAVKHNKRFAAKVGIPQSVGEDFTEADKKAGKFQGKGARRKGGDVPKSYADD